MVLKNPDNVLIVAHIDLGRPRTTGQSAYPEFLVSFVARVRKLSARRHWPADNLRTRSKIPVRNSDRKCGVSSTVN